MTRASDERPTRRVILSQFGDEYVVELRREVIVLRPKGSRRGGPAEVQLSPGKLYIHAVANKLEAGKTRRRRKPRRGRLTVGV